MNAAIIRVRVQIGDVNPEEPIDLLCKKLEISDFLQKRSVGCLELMSQIWTWADLHFLFQLFLNWKVLSSTSFRVL